MTGPHALKPFLLAFPGPLRDRLVAAVLSGEKVATTGLLVEYEIEDEDLPEVGERSALIDSDGREVAVVEVTAVRVLPLGEADLALALDEGEGYLSVPQWRAAHERFWHGEEMREALGDPAFTVDDRTMLVVERFRVVARTGDAGGAAGARRREPSGV
ncbi:ASCH domain-containing protein [Streptomyces sp. NPDC091278]|uniref:ASCH domain-containing protein n=1 Tax=Streptomyces sp. NPDC091278 TaxID=3155301 RepID=UPI00344DD855